MIGALRKSNQAPSALLERLHEANAIRNRAAHNSSSRLQDITDGDSLQILTILGAVLDWYREQQGTLEKSQGTQSHLPLFLSVGGTHRLDQHQFLCRLRAEMESLEVELRTLTSNQYSQEKPFDQVRELMASCRAALVVGLERSHAYTVFEREKSDRERLHQNQYIPTAWNQIEGSMAAALGLPILVLRDHRLHREGIFEAGNHRHHIRDFDLGKEAKALSSDLRGFLAGWVQHVRGGSLAPGQSSGPANHG
jgi:hypothetical protein